METNQKQTIDISQLTAEQLAHLQAQIEQKKKDEESRKEADRGALAKMENDAVLTVFEEASLISKNIGVFKLSTITKFQPLADLKIELAKASSGQKSFTYNSSDMKKKVVITYNETWKTDDGIHVCIDKAKEWLNAVSASSDEAASIVKVVEKLIASKDGTYSTEGIWDLINAAQEIQAPLLIEAAEAGRLSLHRVPTSISVRVYFQGETGWEQLPLSATKA